MTGRQERAAAATMCLRMCPAVAAAPSLSERCLEVEVKRISTAAEAAGTSRSDSMTHCWEAEAREAAALMAAALVAADLVAAMEGAGLVAAVEGALEVAASAGVAVAMAKVAGPAAAVGSVAMGWAAAATAGAGSCRHTRW